MTASQTAPLALPCLEANGPHVDIIREVLLGVPSVSREDAQFVLDWHQQRLQLDEVGLRNRRPLFVEWAKPMLRLRSWPDSRQGPLGRAIGRRTETVIDATAGWGQDSLRLMTMGYAVRLIERCKVMGALLLDGRRRCFASEGLPRAAVQPEIIIDDASAALSSLSADCIYMDPMFPPKRNASALAKRPLQVLRRLAGDDLDVAQLFEAARATASRRVVVKRPDHAAPLAKPDQSFEGKLVRYDVYLT